MKKTNADICQATIIHEDIINKVLKEIPEDTILGELAGFYKICGDPTRIKMLHGLFISEMCVCDMAAFMKMSVSAISHQLRVLKQARLVISRKDGQVVYYSLNDRHVQQIFNQSLKHITE